MVKVRKKIGSIPIQTIKETVQQQVNDSVSKMQDDVTTFIEDQTAEYPEIGGTFKFEEDPEGRSEMTTDADGKILSYRRKDGTKVEHSLEVNHLKLAEESGNELVQELKKLGFSAQTPVDWSDAEFVEIPIPTVCAVVNIETDSQAVSKSSNINTYIQYWDKGGNYFRKPVILNAQGSSSMGYYIKNQAIDLDDGSKIKFGNWLEMDSFHIKKYFIDVFRGQCIVGYWLTEQVYQTRPLGEQRPWSYLYTNNSVEDGIGDFKEDFISGALAHPDGFPIKVFFNGKNAGIYAFNLKKDRSNYNCKKDNQKHIILDGILGTVFFTANGNLKQVLDGADIGWNNFEVRNPKVDKDIEGNKYDGDYPKEPSDDFLEAKQAIERLTTALTNTKAQSGTEAQKTEFEKYFNVPFLIDYHLISNVIYNYDGYRKNWIWITNDGEKWCPTSYDMDSIFGQHWNGASYVSESTTNLLGTSTSIPTGYLHTLYKEQLDARYNELRDAGIFDADNITELLQKWCNKIGYTNHKEDIEDIVADTPSYSDSTWHNSIARVRNWLKVRIEYLDGIFNYNH